MVWMPLGAVPEGDYRLRAQVIAPKGDVAILLPVGDQTIELGLAAWDGKTSGLSFIDGKEGNANETKLVSPLPTELALEVQVTAKDGACDVAVAINSRPAIRWQGKTARLTPSGRWPADVSCLVVGAMSDRGVRFQSVQVKMLSGKLQLPRPDVMSLAPEHPGPWIDLLKLAKPEAAEGKWALKDGTLSHENGGYLALPVQPQGSYELDLEFLYKRLSTALPLSSHEIAYQRDGLHLPVGDANVALWVVYCGNMKLESMNKQSMGGKFPMMLNQAYSVRVRVMLRDDQADIGCDLGTQRAFRWSGPRSALAPTGELTPADLRLIGIGTLHYDNQVFEYRRLKLRMLSGEAKFPPAPAGGATSAPASLPWTPPAATEPKPLW